MMPTRTVTARWVDPLGEPMRGRAIFTLSHDLRDKTGRRIVENKPIECVLDPTGAISVDLLLTTPTPDVMPQGWYWRVRVCLEGMKDDLWNFKLDAGLGSIDLALLLPTADMPPNWILAGRGWVGCCRVRRVRKASKGRKASKVCKVRKGRRAIRAIRATPVRMVRMRPYRR